MKKWMGLMVICGMVFVLAACGGSNINNEKASPSVTEPADSLTNAPSDTNEVVEEGLTPEPGASLVIWNDANQRGFIEEVGKEFEKQYGVSVKIEELAPPEQVTRLTSDGPAGIAADILVIPHDQIGRAAQAGLIFPNDVFEEETRNENVENSVDAVSYDGTLYGYPFAVETYALFYNKKLIATAPQTMEEVIDFASTFNDVKNNKYALMWELQQFYYNYAFLVTPGGYMFGDKGTNKDDIGLNNEGSIEGGKFLQVLKEKVLPLNTGDVNYDIKKGLFTTDSLAMEI
ncbi:MAG: extracellular solute-binding protein, partial [Paenibacillaceae bacterium]